MLTDSRPSPSVVEPRSEVDVTAQQLAAIQGFTRARRVVEEAATVIGRTREMRMDTDRRLEVVRREHEALIARTDAQLRASGGLLASRAEHTVLLAHRNAWFLDRVEEGLAASGLRVVARLDNGADAVGAAVAEQPDVLLVEEMLAMVPGDQVLRDVRRWCPTTQVLAQVMHGDHVRRFVDAGASVVVTRAARPGDVARALTELVSA